MGEKNKTGKNPLIFDSLHVFSSEIFKTNYSRFLARYRAYGIVTIFFGVSTITFERINRLTSNFAHLEIMQK